MMTFDAERFHDAISNFYIYFLKGSCFYLMLRESSLFMGWGGAPPANPFLAYTLGNPADYKADIMCLSVYAFVLDTLSM